jgi:hypothetical protein
VQLAEFEILIMVKIIGGEILSDADPRVLQYQQQLQQHYLHQAYNTNNRIFPSLQQFPSFSYGHQLNPAANNHANSSSSFPHNPNNPPSSNHSSATNSPSLRPTVPPPASNHSSPLLSSRRNSNFSLGPSALNNPNQHNSSSHSNSSIPQTSSAQQALAHNNTRRYRDPNTYNLFNLPDIFVYEIAIKPHVYLLVGLLIYLIGPPCIPPIIASFFFYRWHLNKQAAIALQQQQQAFVKFSPYLSSQSRPKPASSIHSLSDYNNSSNSLVQ